jgi:excisionase family DNA binding protein
MRETTGILLTMKEAAEILRVSSRHLHNLRAKGLLPVVKLGGAVRVRPVDLERMAEKLLVGGWK